MENILITLPVLVALTIAVVEIIKRMKMYPNRFLPLTSLVVGIVLNALLNVSALGGDVIFWGLIVGASASGLFDQTSLIKK